MKNGLKTVGTMGARIKAARDERGLSQQDLAEALGFKTATAISLIENGERGVSTETLKALGDVLHRDVQYFLGEDVRPVNLQVALRADKDLTREDKDAILRFINLAKNKNKKDGK